MNSPFAPTRRKVATALAAALLASALAPSPALAEMRLGRETDADYRINVMTWWEIPFRSVVRQRYDFSCGSAAVATLLTYHYGRATTEREVFTNMWEKGDQATIQKVGFSMLEMKNYLDGQGYHTNGVRVSVDQISEIQQPMIVLMELHGFSHFVVIKGIRDGQILVGDSVLGLRQYSAEDFDAMWNNIALVIVDKPVQNAARFNLARDWGPWSTAPIQQESQVMQLAVSDSTLLLQPYYQILPEFLLDVNVGTVR